jgi:nucleoside-diphosphate-sugar epimerase
MLVLIAGITGSLGQRLANIAISKGLSVRGLGRSPDNLNPELSRRLESFVKSDSYYDIPAIDKAVTGVDAVINTYAPTGVLDLDGHLILLRAAERSQIKIFIASSWSRDWSNIKFGDFEHYNNHIAFEHQIATTSSIRPVYVITGLFADLLFSPYGPGGFDASGKTPRMRYWGNGDNVKLPWSTQEDAAAWTIDILMHGDGVQAGNGGFFRIRSGETTVRELASVYEKVFGKKVDVTREGSLRELETQLARLRKEKGRTGYLQYMEHEAEVLTNKGLWAMRDLTVLDQFKKPTPLEDHFQQVKAAKA